MFSILPFVFKISLCDVPYIFECHLFVQSYNRDLFIFLYFLLIIVSAMASFTIHNEKSPLTGKSILYLNRHQTEEWKGWMQVVQFVFIYDVCLLIMLICWSFDFGTHVQHKNH